MKTFLKNLLHIIQHTFSLYMYNTFAKFTVALQIKQLPDIPQFHTVTLIVLLHLTTVSQPQNL